MQKIYFHIPRQVILFLILCSIAPLNAAEDFLMGSVVKSDTWKIDRANDQEIFDGNVSFRNPAYDLKADHAVYDRKLELWTVRGSVYCLRKFEDGSNIELNCEHGKYFEALEKTQLYRGADRIKVKYLDPKGKPLYSRCDRINAENSTSTMDFLGNFYLLTETMEIFSENGFYNNNERSFLIRGSTPVAVGTQDGRDFAMTGETIKFFRDTGDVKLYNNVAGWVKAGDIKSGTASPSAR